MRRPTTSAWLTNLLARRRPTTVQQVVDLGAALRDAQIQRQADELRRLSAERGRVVAAAVREALRIADGQAKPASDATTKEIQGTLEAAIADPAAAAAVQSGLLTTALSYSGFGEVDVGPAIAVPTGAPRPAAKGPTPKQARENVRAAERDVTERRRHVREVTERVEGLQRQLAALDEQRERIKREAGRAATVLHTARHELDEAARKVERLKSRLPD